jgi:phage-related minor tail protein
MEKIYEELKVLGKDLVDKVGELIHEGNVRRVIIKDDKGHTFMEVPLTVAAIGAIIAPLLAAVGALAGMAAHFTVGVERTPDQPPAEPPAPPAQSPDAT